MPFEEGLELLKKVVGKTAARRTASAAKEVSKYVSQEFNTVEDALEWLVDVQ